MRTKSFNPKTIGKIAFFIYLIILLAMFESADISMFLTLIMSFIFALFLSWIHFIIISEPKSYDKDE